MEAFRQAILTLVKEHSQNLTAQVTAGVVSKINGYTCTVEREALPPLEDVRLNAIEGDFKDLFVIIPKIGSQVLCASIDNQSEETTIIKYTDIEKVVINIKGAKFEMFAGKFQIKNETADLKKIVDDLLISLNNAKILTPNGVGRFADTTKQKFNQIKEKNNELFK